MTLAADVRRAASGLGALLAMLATYPAHAAPSEVELRAARQLFVDAEKDEDAARWADALDKLHQVAQVKRTAGIRYHVALCEEHLGQLAAALDEYTSAEGQARAESARDVLALVGKRIADLGPRVPRLTIRVAPGGIDAVVTLDGTRLPSAILGTALPVDPGQHRIEASATGRPSASQVVTVRERDVTSVDLEIPAAAARPLPSPPEPPPPAAPSEAPGVASLPAARPLPADTAHAQAGAPFPTAAVLATGGTVVLAAGGIGAFLLAGSAHTRAVQQCAQIVSTSTDACNSQKNGVRGWDFTAAAAWLAGAAAGTVAVVLWARPEAPSTSASAAISVGPGSVVLGGHF